MTIEVLRNEIGETVGFVEVTGESIRLVRVEAERIRVMQTLVIHGSVREGQVFQVLNRGDSFLAAYPSMSVLHLP